jgi:hypothetical protein
MAPAAKSPPEPARRVDLLDWTTIATELHRRGFATTPALLTPAECAALATLYDDENAFRSRIVMERFRFGLGEYKYLAYPLPPLVQSLRQALYPRLAPVANAWAERLGAAPSYPPELGQYLERCHAAGQTRPTPLILRYEEGGYNCLHQDLYGEHVFPVQATILLSRRGEDFEGGEFVLTEQRPRAQSMAEVVMLEQGEMVLFAVNQRPVEGQRGAYRVTMRHGVSRLKRGRRFTLGIIFHDAS